MQIALYILLGILIAGAIAMQIWILAKGPSGARGGIALIRLLNIALLLGLAVIVVWALSRG